MAKPMGQHEQTPKDWSSQVSVDFRIIDVLQGTSRTVNAGTVSAIIMRLNTLRDRAANRGVVMTIHGVLDVVFHDSNGDVAKRLGYKVEEKT